MAPTAFFDNSPPTLLFTRYRYLLHIAFWLGMVFYEVLIWGLVDNKFAEKFTTSLIELPIKISACYFTLYCLIDKYLITKKYTTFLVSLILSMAFFGIVLRALNYYFIYPTYYPAGLSMSMMFLPRSLSLCLWSILWWRSLRVFI